MKHLRLFSKASLFALVFLPLAAHAQGTLADYQRAGALRAKYQAAAVNIPETPSWLDGTRFWYRKSVSGGHAFVIVDATTGAKTSAFDHEKLAAALSKGTGTAYTAVTLPFTTLSYT